jgi:hypothetical protein
VLAARGKAAAEISFDSGFEVWVYRIASDTPPKPALEKAPPGNTEFVVLFAPSGIATKARIRPDPMIPASTR